MLLRKLYRYIKNGSPYTQDYLAYKKFLLENPYKYKTSYFNLTIDFELGWSRRRAGREVTNAEKSLERSRRSIALLPILLELSDKYRVPVTFAIVGQIGVDKVNGKDLIEAIKNTIAHHEIASHSFSHVDFSDEETTKEIAEYEITQSAKFLRQYDSQLRTFIFPNNHPAYLDLIKDAGFNAYRVRENQEVKKDTYGLYQFPLGIWLSPQAFVPKDLIKLINTGISRKQIVNFWCHLFEFDSASQFKSFFESIFAHIESCQKTGKIETLTVRDIIKEVHE